MKNDCKDGGAENTDKKAKETLLEGGKFEKFDSAYANKEGQSIVEYPIFNQ